MSPDHFIRLADSLVEFDSDLTDNRYPLTSLHAIDLHRSEIKTTWSRIKSAYEKFLLDVENEDDTERDKNSVDLESFKVKFKSTYITYCNCLAKLSELYEIKRSDALPKIDLSDHLSGSSSAYSETTHGSTNSYSFHLPPCDIEVFNGDYMSWPTFRDMFTAIYRKNSKLSPVEKLFHLTNKTEGEAREIVKKSPLTNEGFDLAWTNLCARFENRRVLINGQLKTLFNLSNITSESGQSIKELQRDINSCISTLQLYDIDVKSWDPIFVFLCSNRLPDITLNLWEQGLSDKTSIPKWADLDRFLTNRYRTLESVSEIRNLTSIQQADSKPKNPNKSSNPSKKINSFQNNVSVPKCSLCPKESHIIRKCPLFLKMNYTERFNKIKKQNLCLNCFSKTHFVKNCNSRHSCYQCRKRHHTLLHKVSDSSNSSSPLPSLSLNSNSNPNSSPFSISNSSSIQSTSISGGGIEQSCFASNCRGVLLGTTIVNVCCSNVKYKARALIDSGSEGTFISERLFDTLKLPFKRTNAQISGLNNTISANAQRETSFVLSSTFDENVKISVNALVVSNLAGNLPSHTIESSNFSDLPQIQLADPQFYKSSKIDILIGGDLFPSIMLSGIKHEICGSLMAQETIFGWILTGPVSINSSKVQSTIASYFCEITLTKEISPFWEVENLPGKNFQSPSDKICENPYMKTKTRNSDGRYIVSLPFEEGFPESLNLGQFRTSAMAQFYGNEARLLRVSKYDTVVEEYLQLDHMYKVTASEFDKSPAHYYLPHHSVIKPQRSTTKVHVFFNASSASSNGLSLNDILNIGPILQTDLTLLILKWRFFQYVFNADIQKMYRQILVNPEHTPYKRILFQNNIVKNYELKPVIFEVNCSPHLAIRTIFQLADDVETIYPTPSISLRNYMYVDVVLAGAHSISEAIKAKNELILALQSAGFSLRKWTANSKEVIADFPDDHLFNKDFLDFDDSSTAKTLGIRWNARSDTFYFTTKHFSESSKFTKREVLSQIAKLFVHASWLSPCIVIAKILMQRIWPEGTDWDEVLSPESLSQWKNFKSNYPIINEIQIPRWIHFIPNAEIQFHGFCDASERAFAAALNIRIANGNTISTHLVSSKTKVAPVKTLSIPRLELCGAVLLAQMIDNLIPRLDVETNLFFCWTGSITVLSWPAKPPSYFHNFYDVLERFSSFPKFRSNFYMQSTTVTSPEIVAVRDRLISICQKVCYPNEFKALSCRQSVASSSSILSLNPFLDPDDQNWFSYCTKYHFRMDPLWLVLH